ncbi:MAG: SPOR domain-containing protein [Candidatus Cloacimonetes bacterium]|nr:SPOR domain-containing protein [Candidatus Cloacimonadota bacterium]
MKNNGIYRRDDFQSSNRRDDFQSSNGLIHKIFREKNKLNKTKLKYLTYIFIFHLLFFSSLNAQQGSNPLSSNQQSVIERIQNSFQENTLVYNDPLLVIDSLDSDSLKAAKNYYRALLHKNIEEVMSIHTNNFSTFNNEHYGQMSGIQLVSIDFINHDHDNALIKLNQINNDNLPEALYWRIKINQMLQIHNTVLSLGQSFIRQFPNHQLIPFVWIMILETNSHQGDLSGFERNYRTFSNHSNFEEYKAYLLFLNGMLLERTNVARARTIYSQIVNEFPQSQYRVQAEDRLFALRGNVRGQPIVQPPPVNPPPNPITPPIQTGFGNVVENRYEDLVRDSFYIQFGVFSTEVAARNFVATLNRDGIQTFQITKPVGARRLHAVVQGPYSTQTDAQANQRIYNSRNHQSFIFRAE